MRHSAKRVAVTNNRFRPGIRYEYRQVSPEADRQL
jgi:hypothetical protein